MQELGSNQDAVSQEQARIGFSRNHQYISTLQDLIMYSKGFKLERYAQDATTHGSCKYLGEILTKNERVVKTMVATNEEFSNPVNFGVKDKVVVMDSAMLKMISARVETSPEFISNSKRAVVKSI